MWRLDLDGTSEIEQNSTQIKLSRLDSIVRNQNKTKWIVGKDP